jgi:hypothetical protein
LRKLEIVKTGAGVDFRGFYKLHRPTRFAKARISVHEVVGSGPTDGHDRLSFWHDSTET